MYFIQFFKSFVKPIPNCFGVEPKAAYPKQVFRHPKELTEVLWGERPIWLSLCFAG
jgi:hypothetical protein